LRVLYLETSIGKTFYSHQGITYGGLIISKNILVNDILLIFDLLIKDLKNKNVNEIIWKPVPHIYHTMPSEEEVYALFRFGAEKIGCTISSALYLNNKLNFSDSRSIGIKKAKKNGVVFFETKNYTQFWYILTENLEKKYGKKPVHNLYEITQLSLKFPENIKLYVAEKDRVIIGGVVMFLTKKVAHVQYIAANDVGKNLGALDLIFDHLINTVYKDFFIFDFGHSNENMGKYLNENLIFQKEGFGGRGIVYEIYKITI